MKRPCRLCALLCLLALGLVLWSIWSAPEPVQRNEEQVDFRFHDPPTPKFEEEE